MDQGRLERLLSALHATSPDDSVLQRICLVGADGGVGGVGGAGVSRITDGRHDVLAASDEAASYVETLQATLAEGPCVEAVRSSLPAFEPDLASDSALRRWPQFSRAALGRGVAAAFAFPLMTGGVAVGALDLYSPARTQLEGERVDDALILADLAALALERFELRSAVEGVDLSTEAAEPWAHAAVVHNASGMVAEQLKVSVDDALLRLRAVAFATERTVASIADEIVRRQLRLDVWSTDAS